MKTYKKADKNIYNGINEELRIIVKQSIISLKDHKEYFVNNPQHRIINPAKSELGKVNCREHRKLNETTT